MTTPTTSTVGNENIHAYYNEVVSPGYVRGGGKTRWDYLSSDEREAIHDAGGIENYLKDVSNSDSGSSFKDKSVCVIQ